MLPVMREKDLIQDPDFRSLEYRRPQLDPPHNSITLHHTPHCSTTLQHAVITNKGNWHYKDGLHLQKDIYTDLLKVVQKARNKDREEVTKNTKKLNNTLY